MPVQGMVEDNRDDSRQLEQKEADCREFGDYTTAGGQEAELPGRTPLPGNHYPIVLRLFVTIDLEPTTEVSPSVTAGEKKQNKNQTPP